MNVRILFKSICILLVMLAVSAPLYAVNNDYKLFESAIRNNDVTAIQNLVSSGADVNAEDDQGLTVLMCAVATSHNLDITRMLLEAGANVNARTEGGVSALVYAVFIGNTEAVRMLLEAGANVNIRDSLGRPFLNSVVQVLDNSDVICLLLNAGADIDAQDTIGTTALMQAARAKNSVAIDLLIEYGADATILDRRQKRAVDYIVEDDELYATDTYWELWDRSF